MTLSQFMKLMKKYIGTTYSIPIFVTFLTGQFLREPNNDYEKQEEAAGRFDPMERYSATSGALNDIFNGKNRRGTPTTINPDIARDLLGKFEESKFAESISNLFYGEQDELIGKLGNYGFRCDQSDLIDCCTEIYKALLEAAANGKFDVMPGDIGREGGISEEDHWLLAEVQDHCPICQEPLVKKRRGKTIKKYKIVQIYPEDLPLSLKSAFDAVEPEPSDLDSLDNKIALCDDDADDYLDDPTVEEYGKLVKIKKVLIENKKLMDELDSIHLKRELDTILVKVNAVTGSTALKDLRLDALKLPQKIPDDLGLRNRVQGLAIHFYYFIQDRLQELEEAGEISIRLVMAEVNHAYEELNAHHLSQEEIFNRLVSWLLDKTRLPQAQYETAGEIVIAYFIQDCEVFSLETAE